MKTKLLAMAVLAGGSMFAQPGYSGDPGLGYQGYGGPEAGYNQPSNAAIPPSPGAGYVWIPGYWSQNYAQSVWVPGYWALQMVGSGYGLGYYAPGYYGAGYYGGIYFGGGYFRGGYFRGNSIRGAERFERGFNGRDNRGAVRRGVEQGRAFGGQSGGSFRQGSSGRVQSQPQVRGNNGGNRSGGQSRQGGSSSGRSRGR